MNRQSQAENEVDLIEYLKIIYKRRWLILLVVIAGVLHSVYASVHQPETYEASATFFPLTMNYDIKSEGFAIKPQLDIKDMIIAILKSRNMADRVIDQLELKRLWNVKFASDAARMLQGSIKVSSEQNGVIKLAAYTNSADLSARIANAYVDNLEYFNSRLNITAQKQIVQVIDRATVPEMRMPRDTVKKAVNSGLLYLATAIALALLLEFIKRSNILRRITEK